MNKFQPIRKQAIYGVLACLGILGAGRLAAAQAPVLIPRPSIILIVADDLGYGDLGCYGQKQIKTPNLDALAAAGMRFTSFYAGSSVSTPSRGALMTGLHTGHAYVRGDAALSLRAEDVTVAQLLKAAGYHNGLMGEWGLGDNGTAGVPQRKGFDEFVGYLDLTHAHDYYTDHLWRYDGRSGRDTNITFFENADGKKGIYMPDLFTTAAMNFARINRPDRFNRFRSFFLCLATAVPHANNEEGRRTGNGMQVPTDAPYTNELWPQAEKSKAAMITRLDRDVGALLAKLKSLQIESNTVIFFLSATGPHKEGGVNPAFFQSSGPLRGLKRDLYEGGIRVPLIVSWPGRIKPGQVSDQVCAAWDFLPTAMEIAQTETPAKLDGISLVPAFLGRPLTNQHEFLYWESHESGFQQAARSGTWKAVRRQPNQPIELYNLDPDLGEKHDVAADNPKIVAKFEEYFKTARTDSTQFPITVPIQGGTVTNAPEVAPKR